MSTLSRDAESALPVKRCGVAGHEEKDVGLLRPGDAAGVTQRVKVRHDVQGASLMDQTGVQSRSQVARQQDQRGDSAPRFQIRQRYACGRRSVRVS